MLKTISIFLMTIFYTIDPTKSKASGVFYKDFSKLDSEQFAKLAPGRPFMADKWFWEICSKEHPCAEAEGDCDEDYECEEGLTCGFRNCNGRYHNYADCCYLPKNTKNYGECNGNNPQVEHCCSKDNKCEENQGDCDSDEDCKEGLVCGQQECNDMNFSEDADCCVIPDKEHKCAIVGEEKKTRPGVYISSKVEDPFNCRKYFFCIQDHFTKNWTTQHFKCPEKKGFDPVKRECDWMDYRFSLSYFLPYLCFFWTRD